MNRSDQSHNTKSPLEPGQLTPHEADSLGQPYKAWPLVVLLHRAGVEVPTEAISRWSPEQVAEARTWSWNEVNGDKSPPPQFVLDGVVAALISFPREPLRINAMTPEVVEARLTYKRPTPEHVKTMEALNEKILDLGKAIGDLPEGMMKSKAVTDLVLLRMVINAAVIGDGIPAGTLAK